MRPLLPKRWIAPLRMALCYGLKRPVGVRRYLHRTLTLEQFFAVLKERQVEYVVLRWFEDLPQVAPGEDIDLLISDADLERIADLFAWHTGRQAFDIYSVSGAGRTRYRNGPYYPPHLASEILRTRRWHRDLYAIPDPSRHLLSLAYHVVFHKGSRAGTGEGGKLEERYAQALAALAPEEDVTDYLSLYRLLSSAGWVPPLDTFRMLALFDPWIMSLLPPPASHPAG